MPRCGTCVCRNTSTHERARRHLPETPRSKLQPPSLMKTPGPAQQQVPARAMRVMPACMVVLHGAPDGAPDVRGRVVAESHVCARCIVWQTRALTRTRAHACALRGCMECAEPVGRPLLTGMRRCRRRQTGASGPRAESPSWPASGGEWAAGMATAPGSSAAQSHAPPALMRRLHACMWCSALTSPMRACLHAPDTMQKEHHQVARRRAFASHAGMHLACRLQGLRDKHRHSCHAH
jgi:hypothetical protein